MEARSLIWIRRARARRLQAEDRSGSHDSGSVDLSLKESRR
jgi:hypothetical protein